MEHKLAQPPTRDPETLDCIAKCACGDEFRSNDKDTCWSLLIEHTMPHVQEEIGKITA